VRALEPSRALNEPSSASTSARGWRALVTGAYGLLGSALTRALLDAGADVVVLRHRTVARSALVLDGLEPHVAVVSGSVLDRDLLAHALREHAVDTVFHLAAQSVVGAGRDAPAATFETNVRGTWSVLEACREVGTQRVVVASSDKAYGQQPTLPYHEELALRPRAAYETSKAAADLVARSYWHSHAVPVAVTRFANLYGGGDLNRSALSPGGFGSALARPAPVLRSDGTSQRDFLYVDDAADAYLAIAAALDGDGARGEAFNAGGGRPHAVREVVELICRLAGSEVEPEIRGSGTPAGEINRQWVDHAKLTQLTGWRPRVALEAGLRRTIEWYRSNPEALEEATAIAFPGG
jgi:CDP-glucose 4,6-dehydratase